jgi:hypothetical protein
MRFMADLGLPLPEAFKTTAEYVLNTDLLRTLSREPLDLDRVRELLEEVQSAKVKLDAKGLAYAFQRTLERLAHELAADPSDIARLVTLQATAATARSLQFEIDMWQIQNVFFALLEGQYPSCVARAAQGDAEAGDWTQTFEKLGEQLGVYVKAGA